MKIYWPNQKELKTRLKEHQAHFRNEHDDIFTMAKQCLNSDS